VIQFLAKKTALYLANDSDDVADVEVIEYGYYLLYQEWFVRILALLVALPLGLFFYVLASIITFSLIRKYAMGAHAKYPIVCKIITLTVWFGPAVLAGVFAFSFPWIVYVGLYIFGFVLLMLYAPAETDVKKVRDAQERMRLKKEAILWLSLLFFLAVVFHERAPTISLVITTVAVMACCMVHPWVYWANGFDPVTREVRV